MSKVHKEVGLAGFLFDDHVPMITGDTAWRHRPRAYAWGYMRALLDMLDSAF